MTKHSPAHILSTLLIADGLAGDPSKSELWPAFVNFLPNDLGPSSKQLSCYDTQGIRDGRILRTGEVIEHPGVQIRFRASQSHEAYSKAGDVALHLDALHRREIQLDSVSYLIINFSRQSPIVNMGTSREEKSFSNLTINYTLTIKEN